MESSSNFPESFVRLSVLVFICLSLFIVPGSAYSAETPDLPSRLTEDAINTCREVKALAEKYGADSKQLDTDQPDRRALAASFISVADRILEKCDKEGREAIPPADMKRFALLLESLKSELEQYEGYQTRREAIAQMLEKPEVLPFIYKFGANGMFRAEGAGNYRLVDASFKPGGGEGRVVYRVKPYFYWHPTDWLDIHAEGQGYGYAGGVREFGRASLYQGYLEARLPGHDWLSLKGGRQEFIYGSTFIVGADSFYDGLSFDAMRLRLKPVDKFAIDFLAGSYAIPFSGGIAGSLYGVYATYSFSEGNSVEAYHFRDTGSTDHHAGEYLNIWGLRGTAEYGPVSMEFEPVYESGRQYSPAAGANGTISAFGGHLDLNADTTFSGLHNHIFASYAYGSGDRAAPGGAGAGKEFRNPNNNTSLIGDMGVIGDLSGDTFDGHHASGLQVFTLGWGVDLQQKLNVSASGHYFRANDTEAGFSRNLGIETDFIVTYAMTEGLSFIIGYDRFFTGGFFRDAVGSSRDIDYGYMMVQFDLSRSKTRGSPGRAVRK
jgi:Alginate export